MSLFHAGFWKDYVVVVVTTIIIGAGLAAGIAAGLDAAFGEAVRGVLGEAGEFDLIVHVRAPSAEAAAAELTERLKSRHGDIVVTQGVTVAGNANFFVSLPDVMQTQSTLEQLTASLRDLPGFNGYSWIVEPSISVTGLRPGMRDLLALEAASIPGVRAPVRNGSSITVLLESADDQGAVAEALRNRLDGQHIVEIRLAEGGTGDEAQIVRAIYDTLSPRTLRDVTASSGRAGTRLDDLADDLEEYLTLWRRLLAAGGTAAEVAGRLVELLDVLEPALALVDGPEQQGERLSAAVRSGDGVGAVREALLSVIASHLIRSISGQAAAAPGSEYALDGTAQGSAPVAATDLAELRAVLTTLAEEADALQHMAESDVLDSLEALERLLPYDAGDESAVELLIDADISPEDVARTVREVTGEDVAVFASAAGIVNPNPRAIVMDLLVDVRRTIAGILVVVIGLGALVLDHAVVFSAMTRFPVARRRRPWLAGTVGALLISGMYMLSGAGIPGIGPVWAAVFGALLGLLTMAVSARLSPVNGAEILAGQALGLADGQIMREIVVPAGRPGLMTFFNGRTREFR